ncbi:MAG: CarD family transcriptional regulator, partial [Pseudomonadota bacterium]
MNPKLSEFANWLGKPDTIELGGVPEGYEPLVLATALRKLAETGQNDLVFVARDGQRAADIEAAFGFFAPWADVLHIPAWDCLPYDRVSPSTDVLAHRIDALATLAADGAPEKPRLITVTPNALMQRVPPREAMAAQVKRLAAGQRVAMDELATWLAGNGFDRTPTVRDTGEFAVRGGILDLFAPGADGPVRLDFFGDTLESLREFDVATQRSGSAIKFLALAPMSEVTLDAATIARFRTNYLATFGAATRDDALYTSVSEGRRYAGMEHWLPLFFDELETLFHYLGERTFAVDHLVSESVERRHEQIVDHFGARERGVEASDEGTPYKPVKPASLYLVPSDVAAGLAAADVVRLSPFEQIDFVAGARRLTLDARAGRSFAAERTAGTVNIFEALTEHAAKLRGDGKRVVIASWTEGARDRLSQVLDEHGLTNAKQVANFAEVEALPQGTTGLAVLPLEHGFEAPDLAVIAEQDVLGDRLVKRRKTAKKGADFLAEVSSLAAGDIVVHVDHGIARFEGLVTIEAAGGQHDCLELVYHGDDRLYLPVENIDLLSRYGNADTEVQLDRLGGA